MWYNEFIKQHSCVVVKDNSNVVAFVNILSLKKEIYDKVKHNEMNESQILVTDLELDKDKYFNYLYFSTIAIDKTHRDIQTLRELINITSKKILEIVNQGCELKEVMADCSTPQGQKITQRFLKLKPFMKTSHNSIIHILSGGKFLTYVRSQYDKFNN